jgi:mono/diheme cytochrome c family protein
MSKYLKLILKVVAGLALLGVLGFIVIQFMPVNETNPPVVSEPKWDSPQTKALVERACYDCHSNETKWTWYSKVAPVSWYVAHDVREGRDALNFSEWGASKGEEGEGREGDEGEEVDEITDVISEGEMPPRQYLLIHPEARLTDAEINALIAGLKATFGADGAMVK